MPKPNGFMVFTMEWKQRNAPHLSIPEATQRCGNIWKDMNEEARKPYNMRAKKQKETSKLKPNPLCATGESVSAVLKQKEERETKEQQMKRNIECTVKKSLRNDTFTTDCYFVIAVNYFSKSLKGNIYLPAEISLAQFSLKRGIIKTYHSHINPGVSMYGHLYDAQLHSDETHKLPLPPNAIGENDLASVYNAILNFVRDKETGGYRPLYIKEDGIAIAESIIDFLKIDADANDISLDIYPIQYLFYIMKENACKIGELPPPSNFAAKSFFDRDYFEYHTGISCEYHENIDRSIHCTQSMVVRWCYMFCDYMCKDVAVDIVPGRHIPIQQKVNMKVIEPRVWGNKQKQNHKLFNDESDKKQDFTSCAKVNDDFPSISKPIKKMKTVQPKLRQTDSDISDSELETKPAKKSLAGGNNSRYENIPPQPTSSDFDVNISDSESVSTVCSKHRQLWRDVARENEHSESEFSSTSNRTRSLFDPWESSRMRGRARGRGQHFRSYDSDFPSLK